MTFRLLLTVALVSAAAALTGGQALAAGPSMTLGVAEDAVRAPDLPSAEAKMAQLRLAGFTAVRVTSNWLPGLVAPTADELRELRNVETAAQLNGVTVYVSVYNPGQKTTPLDPTAQSEFARYAAAIAADARGAADSGPFTGEASCYVELGTEIAARMDVKFFTEPAPEIAFVEPSGERAAEKRQFESERLSRWFGS